MEFDRHGLTLTTTSDMAAARYRAATELLFGGRPGAGKGFADALAIDPVFAEAHTGLAFAALFSGDEPAVAPALAAADAAASGLGTAPAERARGQVALVRDLSELNLDESRKRSRAHLSEYPRDELAREAAGLILFLFGRSRHTAELYDHLAPHQGPDPDPTFAASWSFACHEVGRLSESRGLAERALAEEPDHTFAMHSLTHVAYETGRHAEGVDLLEAFFGSYEPIAFYQRHLRWHLALHLLAGGEVAAVRALWSTAVAPDAVPIALGAVEDGAGLLWRWHLYDLSPWDLPWADLAPLAQAVAEFPVTPLPAACAVVVLAALGNERALATLLTNADALASRGRPVPADVLHSVARAARASFAGDWGEVADALQPARPRFGLIGGSRAQRELFEDALLFGLLRSDRHEPARALLAERLARRPSPRDRRLLAGLR
jgi:hypothetical protein